MSELKIKVQYDSVDHYKELKSFGNLADAQSYAHAWVGEHPEIGTFYAVSGDGIGRIIVTGCSLVELFPNG